MLPLGLSWLSSIAAQELEFVERSQGASSFYPVLSTGDATLQFLCPVLGPSVLV